MKVLTVENAIKFEITDYCYERVNNGSNFKKVHEKEDEIELVGESLKARGMTIFQIITLLSSEIAQSIPTTDLETRVDFRRILTPRLMASQSFLANLSEDPIDQDSYWELIDILGEVINFQNRQKSTVPIPERT